MNRTVGLLVLAAGVAASVGTYFVVTMPTGAATTPAAAVAPAPAPSSWVSVQTGDGPSAAPPAGPTATGLPTAGPIAATPVRTSTARPAGTATAVPTASAAAPVKIMALGDSITYGVGSQSSGSYRTGLRRKLVNAGLAVDFVGSVKSGSGPDTENEGHNGWTIAQVTAKVDGWLAAQQPDVVLLHIGTNDMNKNLSVAGAPDRLEALVDAIHAARPTAQVYLQQIVGSSDAVVNNRITAYNAAMPAVISGKGSWLHLVDQSEVSGTMLKDALHPNDAGYAQMADNLYAALAATYELSGA
ncbi:SGNH/GDSL hydrolase family protein [Spirilliplanes yamanashiensis]|uniref:SGNH hydrolase-type esterase domain-containing protein n=1 Tax=Spirilliplanes yamanashiensis TaxID=42233 RepID=A0A8J3YAK2_9ACTN|nr:SGNH/GDSL hydrolase family protein [Spirilliplanes yamanashiensis]MDP9817562.1 lysophospholipase L1-like esterase [Spirilliplanes yamanashiensis]GIJ04372.1 hypothetical protein Sya03_37240 [Spirilliplanes yamanashiensis]